MIYLVEITACIDAAGTTTVLRATTAAHYATWPTDSPASTQYLPRVKTAGLFRRDIASPGRIYGATQTGYGIVELTNADGALDGWLDYAFDGRQCRILCGEEGAAYSSFVVVLQGTMDQLSATDPMTLTIRIRDRLHELDKPIQTAVYGGTNVLPDGVDGVEDLAGRKKPRLYGDCANFSPVCVNTTRLIYQCSDQALYSIAAVRDQGIVLTQGAAYSSQADMEANAPAASNWRAWLAGGMFRLGSQPAGQITCDAAQYDPAGSSGRPASLLSEIAQDAGIAAGDISNADVAALSAAAPYGDCGLYLGPDAATTALDAMDYLASSASAWYGFDRLGVLRMQRLGAPDPAAVSYTVRNQQILSLARRASDDAGAGIPAWAATVRYFRNWTPQTDGDLAGSVTLPTRQWLRQEWRSARGLDASIRTRHPQAAEIFFDCATCTAAYAAIEAAWRLNALKRDLALYDVKLHLRSDVPAALELGATVRVEATRWRMADKAFVVVGILHDPIRQSAEVTLWG